MLNLSATRMRKAIRMCTCQNREKWKYFTNIKCYWIEHKTGKTDFQVSFFLILTSSSSLCSTQFWTLFMLSSMGILQHSFKHGNHLSWVFLPFLNGIFVLYSLYHSLSSTCLLCCCLQVVFPVYGGFSYFIFFSPNYYVIRWDDRRYLKCDLTRWQNENVCILNNGTEILLLFCLFCVCFG